MDKAESIAHFQEHVVWQERANVQLVLERDFQSQRERLADEFMTSFQEICREIRDAQVRGEKGAIGYITYSMLRTELLEGRYIYRVEAMDNGWVFDRHPYVLQYEAGWAFQHLDTLRSRMMTASRMYGGRVSVPVIERMLLTEAIAIHRYVIALARAALPQAVELEQYRDIVKEPEFEIRVGEYMDLSEAVFKQYECERDSASIRAWLEDREGAAYAYESYRNMDLQNGDYGENHFQFSVFNQCDLSRASLQDSVLIGTKWHDTALAGTDFSRSQVHGGEFRGCDLRGAVFRGAAGADGWKDDLFLRYPGLSALRFAGSDLAGADFSGASLHGADFSAANVVDTLFEGADLTNAVFSRRQREALRLDPQQWEQILWKT
ncbi:pentapeptide repeat-containing protein [Paenibacillus popilliae]|uniref:Uncharacterized low-complexity protein n=1 Tax=Paenibacillus popilliae ATCC 14706 TaxID=1212764 RepID=M9L7Y3_PAEPP|nr:pentapeptide repeat-containing protein [Paenibacillus popilliae]GAC41162.1 uncharacterized low-complexity protein [Paenibacillus popilliae ATCC 14706]